MKDTYSWRYVAERTEIVYDYAYQQPVQNALQKIKSNFSWGPISGFFAVLYQMVEFIILMVIDWIFPIDEICIARNFNIQWYLINPHRFGDHEFRIDSLGNLKSE